MDPLESKKAYQDYVDKKSPNSKMLKNCFNAFWVGGLICTIGQVKLFLIYVKNVVLIHKLLVQLFPFY